MITITKLLYEDTLKNKYTSLSGKISAEYFEKLPSSLFFDIETTGLSARNSMCYLIGAVYILDDEWHYTQWFADTPGCEEELLRAFFTFAKDYKYLIHFNGDGFDIPFLEQRCKYMNIPHSLIIKESECLAKANNSMNPENYANCTSYSEALVSIDLFRHIRKLSKILNLENYKQKTIEQFLEINREDLYSGGELISVYKEYVIDHDPAKQKLLLLHNHDDITGLIDILPILSYEVLLSDVPLSITDCQINEASDYHKALFRELLISAKTATFFPKRLTLQQDPYYLVVSDNQIKVRVPMVPLELKYFYSNYKDYYYLPDEDTAIYKNVAFYVDKNHRVQAKADTCYTRKKGIFVSQPKEVVTPAFKEAYKDKNLFFEIQDSFMKDVTMQSGYLDAIIKHIVQHH